jgi:hypothetical protein
LCEDTELADKNFSYDYLKAFDFSFNYKGYKFEKINQTKIGAGFKDKYPIY